MASMRTALLLLIASALAASFALPAGADAGATSEPASAPAAAAGDSKPTDAELARKRLARCQLHPETCVQQDRSDGKGERNKAKEKPDSDSAPQTQKPPPESVPR
jgi:hypothetical protein